MLQHTLATLDMPWLLGCILGLEISLELLIRKDTFAIPLWLSLDPLPTFSLLKLQA